MKQVLTIFGAVALVCVAGFASASSIRVSQESSAGAGDFDGNVLGFIDAYTSPGTIADFYSYGDPVGASYNGDQFGGPDPLAATTQMFFVEGTDGLGLVTVHNAPGGTGGTAQLDFLLAGAAGSATDFLVRDDSGETHAVGTSGADQTFFTSHRWFSCCTDGSAIGDVGTDFTLFASFAAYTGLTDWTALDGDTTFNLSLATGQRVRFDFVATSDVPLPAGGVLMLTGLAGLGLWRRRAAAR